MATLQLPSCRAHGRSSPPPLISASASAFWGGQVAFINGRRSSAENLLSNGGPVRVLAMSGGSSSSSFKMNLNEYMVTLDKPLGIRFAISFDGRIFVHALKEGGNAEKSSIVMVGDTLKKAGDLSAGRLAEAVTSSSQ